MIYNLFKSTSSIILFIINYNYSESTVWKCADKVCPNRSSSSDPNYFETYSYDECCSTGENVKPKNELHTCNYHNETYYKGQRVYMKDHPCYTCVCDENFSDNAPARYNTKSCYKNACSYGTQFLPNMIAKCAPVYLGSPEGLCCPKDWICRKYFSFIALVIKEKI